MIALARKWEAVKSDTRLGPGQQSDQQSDHLQTESLPGAAHYTVGNLDGAEPDSVSADRERSDLAWSRLLLIENLQSNDSAN